ncbi:hypothetical protein HHK36_014511 [Tetracentron sinense]|uniref:Uncharacterized protein n=1 Tax=Tetracentron sinense TaxID=13715 RepID=A0A835DCZ5_TETSI|nr:hypothetical protein HHK36_014511 [Tetracentron sinense]
MTADEKDYSSLWSREQEKAFENALAIHPEDSSDRWEKIAADVPGKTLAEIQHHYELLVEDIKSIESGNVPSPCYVSSSDDSTDHAGEDGAGKMGGHFGNFQNDSSHGGKALRLEQERRKGIAWTEDEHRDKCERNISVSKFSCLKQDRLLQICSGALVFIENSITFEYCDLGYTHAPANVLVAPIGARLRLFLLGLDKYGKGDWRSISRNFVVSRTPTQVASHAQKYFIRLNSMNKERRRSSIHDITSVGNGDIATPQGPITGQTNEGTAGASSGKLTKPQLQPPIGASGVGVYGGTTIGQPIGGPLISAVGTPVNIPSPAHMAYGVRAPVPRVVVPGSPMNMTPMTFPMLHTSAHRMYVLHEIFREQSIETCLLLFIGFVICNGCYGLATGGVIIPLWLDDVVFGDGAGWMMLDHADLGGCTLLECSLCFTGVVVLACADFKEADNAKSLSS